MKKFEYKIIPIEKAGFFNTKIDVEALETQLTGEGLVGWEAVSTFVHKTDTKNEIFILMKREILENHLK